MTALLRRREGPVLVLEPAAGPALPEELTKAWRELDESDDLRAAVLAVPETNEGTVQAWDLSAYPLHTTKPVIAAVDGDCHGLAFELALACDLRVAGEGSSFGLPDLSAEHAYRVASVLLPRISFSGLGLELLLSGRTVDPAEARQARLVTRVVPAGKALESALALAQAMLVSVPGDFRKQRLLGLSGVPLVSAMRLARES